MLIMCALKGSKIFSTGPQFQRCPLPDKDKFELYLAIRIVLIGHPANGVDISSLSVSPLDEHVALH